MCVLTDYVINRRNKQIGEVCCGIYNIYYRSICL